MGEEEVLLFLKLTDHVLLWYRLMPAIQQIYSSVSQLSYVSAALDKLYIDIKNLKSLDKNYDTDIFLFNKSINLKEINFNYPNSTRTTFKNITLNINTIQLLGDAMGIK